MKTKCFRYILMLLPAFLVLEPLQAQLSPGMMVQGSFAQEEKEYIGEILTVNETQFTCRFVHSGSVYTFQKVLLKGDPLNIQASHGATVISAGGGKYTRGTRFSFRTWEGYDDNCHYALNPSSKDLVIVKFSDGRSFLGDVVKHEYDYYVTFRHSGSLYIFDINDVVIKSGGTYAKGTKATIFCTRPVLQAKLN